MLSNPRHGSQLVVGVVNYTAQTVINTCKRPWRRLKRRKYPLTCFVLVRMSYKAFANLGLSNAVHHQYLVTLDTGGNSSFINWE